MVDQIALQLVSRAGHDGLPPQEAVAHGMVQSMTLLSGQGLPDGVLHQGLHVV